MPKYEILTIVDPQQNKEVEIIANEVFGKDVQSIKKLERTTLAYEINKTRIANYFQIDVVTDSKNIKEFTRRSNISKAIWRLLVINMDSERALDSLKHMKDSREWKPRSQFDNRRHDSASHSSDFKHRVTKEEVPKVTKEEVPKVTKEEVPKVTKEEVPKVTKEEVPKVTKEEVPKVTKEEAPKTIKEKTTKVVKEKATKASDKETKTKEVKPKKVANKVAADKNDK